MKEAVFECCDMFNHISDENKNNNTETVSNLFMPPSPSSKRTIADVCIQGETVFPDTPAINVFNYFKRENELSAITVVNNDNTIVGFVPRTLLFSVFGGQYGFTLNMRKSIHDVMQNDFLIVEHSEKIESVSLKATSRAQESLYDPIVICKNKKYLGIITVRKLLDSIIALEVTERTLEIQKAHTQLQEHSAKAERDMNMAALVQKSFYPSHAPHTASWDCAFEFKPMASVSGDVYDFYYSENKETSNRELRGLSLFDVSGHGVASGLVGILAKSIAYNTFKKSHTTPLHTLMNNINEQIIREKGDVENYLTGLLLRINGKKIEYVNAGHTELLLKSAKTNEVKTVNIPNGDFKGRFLGFADLPTEFKTLTISIASNSILLAYTDCLIESRNLCGEEFGFERLKKVFHAAPNDCAQNALDFIMECFNTFTEGLHLKDDLTLIVLKRL